MGLFNNKKKNAIVMTTEYQPYHGLPTPPPTAQKSSFSDFEPLQKRETRDLKYKTNIRLLRFATRTISLLLSAYMIYTMTLTLIMYLSTRNRKFQSSSTPVWGTTPKILWPTILILAIAVTTAIMNIITISAYLWSIRAANKSGDFTTFAGYVMLLVEIVTWGVASGVYKQQDQGEDLWGFACGVKKKGGNLLEEAKAFVDFTNLCRKQDLTWIACLVQTAFHIMTVVTLVLVLRRMRGKNKIEEMRTSREADTLQTKGFALETFEEKKPKFWRKYVPLANNSK